MWSWPCEPNPHVPRKDLGDRQLLAEVSAHGTIDTWSKGCPRRVANDSDLKTSFQDFFEVKETSLQTQFLAHGED